MISPGALNRSSIASRLIELESRQRGLVRIRINPSIVPHVTTLLKEMGFKKPIFKKPEQFIVDCALSYHLALTSLLEVTLLSGPNGGNGEIQCWYGNGRYAGWQGLFQISDFAALGQNKIFVVIKIHPFIAQVNEFLERVG